MKRVLRVTKVTKVLRIKDLLRDMLLGMSDEDLMNKHALRWTQLEKIYRKLYYGGHLGKAELLRRIEMRVGKNVSHIPFAEIEDSGIIYRCEICGFTSPLHFSTCPRCHEINLRRLTRRISPTHDSESSGPSGAVQSVLTGIRQAEKAADFPANIL